MAELKKKERILARRVIEQKHAEQWMKVCQARQRVRDNLLAKVEHNCAWIDTDAIAGFRQRYETEVNTC